MKSKKIVTLLLLIFVVGSILFLIAKESGANKNPVDMQMSDTETTIVQNTTKSTETGDKVVVYYFHGNRRCGGCGDIEAYSKETVETKFADKIKSGAIEWKTVNVEKPENKHFIQEFEVYGPTLLISRVKKGKQADWKKLDKVWELIRNKSEFSKYVENEIKALSGR
jgi:hypothetical protein